MSFNPRTLLSNLNPWRAGVAMMLVGGSTLGVGLVQTTGASVQPDCPGGTTLVAKFNWSSGGYAFESPSGNSSVVSITKGSTSGGKWSSSKAISRIVVKGGPGSVTTTLTPPQMSGNFSDAGLPPVGNGNTPDISNVQFCGDLPVTTTTSKATTTSTTTTTAKPATTTSTSTSTSTTAKPTTTVAPTTTKATTTTTKATTTTTDDDGPSTTRGSTTTTKVTTSTSKPTTTTSTTTTTIAPTTTKATTTTAKATTTTAGTSTTTTPAATSSTTPGNQESTSTSLGSTTTVVGSSSSSSSSTSSTSTTSSTTTTTRPGQVLGAFVTATSISPDDNVQVLSNGTTRPLAVTGGTSTPLIVLGISLFGAGAALVIVTRLRQRHAGA